MSNSRLVVSALRSGLRALATASRRLSALPCAAISLGLVTAAAPASADPVAPDSILVTVDGTIDGSDTLYLLEYSRNGDLLQTFPLPGASARSVTGARPRDVVGDAAGNVHVLRLDSFGPDYLSTLDPATGAWTQTLLPLDTRTFNRLDDDLSVRDGVALSRDFRIDLDTLSVETIRSRCGSYPCSELSFGLDGRLYGLGPGSLRDNLFVMDEQTLRSIGSALVLPAPAGGIAVDPDGTLYVGGFPPVGGVRKYDPEGNLLAVLDLPMYVGDVDLHPDGTLVLGGVAYSEATSSDLPRYMFAITDVDFSELQLVPVGVPVSTARETYVGFATLTAPPPLLEVVIDIKPGSDANVINLLAKAVIPVAILGTETFDVRAVDGATLAFGPAGASAVHDLSLADRFEAHLEDVNADGFTDLVSHYRSEATGIAVGDAEACLTGALLEGTEFRGSDVIVTTPACGIGFELVLALPPLMWLRRRLRRA